MHIETFDYPLIHIPAGAFTMGTIPTGMRKTDPEEPQRSVQLDAYAIGMYQVTNAQYAQFVEATEYAHPPFWDDERLNAPDFPVVGVSWHDAINFLEWLGALEGVAYRLPSEAEWEKAARGTNALEYPWGDIWDASRANTSESGNKRLMPVGSYPSGVSPYGCYDMAGNAYDWCFDWFHAETYKYSPAENPLGASEGRRKVIRGGSWIARGEFAARCANRAAYEPIRGLHSVGIRIAMDKCEEWLSAVSLQYVKAVCQVIMKPNVRSSIIADYESV